jgi:hypothetical protein
MLYFDKHREEIVVSVVLAEYMVTSLDQIESLLDQFVYSIARKFRYVSHLLTNVVKMDHLLSTSFEQTDVQKMIQHSINQSIKIIF